jgi:hypothetical protein
MSKRSVLIASLMITALLAGCGGEPAEPTLSVADVQSTAVSAAFTIVAETQAAIPTNTPLPPTETPTLTPAATNTPLPLPTLAATLTNTPSAGGDFCSTRTLSAPKGKETKILIDNKTKYPVQVSLYLNRTELDECGYRGYNIGKNGSVLITDLVYGCYDLWAWSTDPKKPFQVASGTSCINNPDKWTFQITEEAIKFVGP